MVPMTRADPSETSDAETREEALGTRFALSSCGANVLHEIAYNEPSAEKARNRC